MLAKIVRKHSGTHLASLTAAVLAADAEVGIGSGQIHGGKPA